MEMQLQEKKQITLSVFQVLMAYHQITLVCLESVDLLTKILSITINYFPELFFFYYNRVVK